MPRMPFSPPDGLANEDTVYTLPGAWYDGNNVRFRDGPEVIGGWQKGIDDALTGVCRNVVNWTDNNGTRNIGLGTHTKLYVYSGGTLADITPTGLLDGAEDSGGVGAGYGTGTYGSSTYGVPSSVTLLRTWSLDTWGETMLAVPRGGTLYQWSNDTSVVAASIANAPDEIRCMLVTPERQVLALGCNEELSNDFNPLCIRGCDIEDLTDWTTSSSNNAFEHILEGGGQIVAAKMVGPVVGVWTDNNLHQGQYLGYPDQTYRFDRMDRDCGILGPNAVAVLHGIAYWVGRDHQFRVWVPGTRPTIMQCPIWTEFKENLHQSQEEKLIAVSNSKFDEVWFFYPDARDGNENSRYVAFRVTADGPKWFKGEIARTAAMDSGVLEYPMAVSPDGYAYYHEIGTTADGGTLEWSLKSAAFYMDEHERVLLVESLRPDFKDQENDITFTAYVRARPQSSTTTKGPYTLTTSTTKKDFRFTGAIAELEFSGTGFVRFGKPVFDFRITGLR